MTAVTPTGTSTDVFDPWLSNNHWAGGTLTYSFPTDGSTYNYMSTGSVTPLSVSQQNAVRQILNEISSFTGLDFVEVVESGITQGDLRFATDTSTSGAYAYLPSSSESGGDAFFGSVTANPNIGNESYLYFTHEIGHAMGLNHGHEYPAFVASGFDSQEYTVVTYTDYVGDTAPSFDSGVIDWAQTYQQLDIAAMQFLYGANYSTTGELWSGDTTYSFDPLTGEMTINGAGQGTPAGNRIFRTIWDGDGDDTYDLSNYDTDLVVDLAPGGWLVLSDAQLADLNTLSADPEFNAIGNVANALLVDGDHRALIENAIGGSGDDTMSGNSADNRLQGKAGGDVLRGNNGDDTLIGDFGRDMLYGGLGRDTLNGGAGKDKLFGDVGIDKLIGGSGNDRLFGGGGVDSLFGNSGDDTLKGGAGNDRLFGGDDVDTLYGNDGRDTLKGGAGNDRLFGGDDVDTLYGNDGGDTLNGGSGNDRLFGDDGVDTLHGDDGGDTLKGGSGNDRLFGDGGADTLYGNDGGDTLKGGLGNDRLLGGDGVDALFGNDGNDRLNGGSGKDTMTGGLGADTFVFSAATHSRVGSTSDHITDFNSGVDHINLSGLISGTLSLSIGGSFGDTGSGTGGPREPLRSDGANAITKFVGGNTVVLVDVDGDNVADFRVILDGVTSVSAGDFIL